MADSVYDNLINRHTIRNYVADYKIPDETLHEIINIALKSPFVSEESTNQLEFLVCTDPKKNMEAAEAQLKVFPENVQKHMLERRENFGVSNVMSCDASAEIIIYCPPENVKDETKLKIDCGLATMSILIAARAFGLETMCQGVMIGPGTTQVYGLPANSVLLGIAVGKARDDAHTPKRTIKNNVTYL